MKPPKGGFINMLEVFSMQRFKSFLIEALEDGGEGTSYSKFSGGKAPKGKELTSRFDFSQYSPIGAYDDIEDMDEYMDKIEKRLKTVKDPVVVSRLEAELDKTQGLVDKKIAGLAASSAGLQIAAAGTIPVAGALAGRVAGTVADVYGSFADLRNAYKDAKQTYRGVGRSIRKAVSGDLSGAGEELKGAGLDTVGVVARGTSGVLGGAVSILPFGRAAVVGTKTAAGAGLKGLKLGKIADKAQKAADTSALAATNAAKRAADAEDALTAAKTATYPDLETYAKTVDIRKAEASAATDVSRKAADVSVKSAKVAERTKRAATSSPKALDVAADKAMKELSLGTKGKIALDTTKLLGKGSMFLAKLAALGLGAGAAAAASELASNLGGGRPRSGGGGEGGGAGQMYVSSVAQTGANVRPIFGG